MIRQATYEDITKIVKMGADFHSIISLPVEYDHESVASTLKELINSEFGAVFVDDNINGAIGGLLYPHYFNKNILTGGELFWWVNRDSRGGLGSKLLGTMEDWVKDMGAVSFQMITLEDYKPDVVGKVYERRGYTALEHTYLKVM